MCTLLLPIATYAFHMLVHFSTGVLACLDGYMNIAMEQTEEYVNGQLKAKYGDTFIRGNNGGHTQSCRTCMCMYLSTLHLTRLRRVCVTVLYISTQKKRS